ncbi:MAG TPA: phytoene/squalene synthase family protein [Thermoleophilaceae bacterium]|nr:phytoene/squalene synthase family protein [Thermoleophilaceae bacterium]
MSRVHTTVRREDMTPELRASYAACRRVHRRHDPTYYWATRRLPSDVRPAVHAVYAFVRSADELVDGPGRAADPDARRAALDGLERALQRARAGDGSDDPTVAALADAGARHDLPLDELDVYMRSMRIDCAPVRMASWSELDGYMDGSAAAVGRIMAPLLGAGGSAESFASLGQAFQLTNFIRDVREDFELDRIYLPGIEESELAAGTASAGFKSALAEQVGRARELFRQGAPALGAVQPRIRPGMRMARAVYVRVLDRVERLDYDVLGASAGLRPWEVAGAALGSVRARA